MNYSGRCGVQLRAVIGKMESAQYNGGGGGGYHLYGGGLSNIASRGGAILKYNRSVEYNAGLSRAWPSGGASS